MLPNQMVFFKTFIPLMKEVTQENMKYFLEEYCPLPGHMVGTPESLLQSQNWLLQQMPALPPKSTSLHRDAQVVPSKDRQCWNYHSAEINYD